MRLIHQSPSQLRFRVVREQPQSFYHCSSNVTNEKQIESWKLLNMVEEVLRTLAFKLIKQLITCSQFSFEIQNPFIQSSFISSLIQIYSLQSAANQFTKINSKIHSKKFILLIQKYRKEIQNLNLFSSYQFQLKFIQKLNFILITFQSLQQIKTKLLNFSYQQKTSKSTQVKKSMKIETFQKIQKKLIDLTLFPVSLFVTICIYSWHSIWEQHAFITTIAFVASSAACLYFLSINVMQKPWDYLRQIYSDNKKYKSLRKIQLDKPEEPAKQLNPQLDQFSESKQASKTKVIQKMLMKKPEHFSFDLQEQEQVKSEPVLTTSSPLTRNKLRQSKPVGQSSFSFASTNQCDAVDLFFSSPSKNQGSKSPKLRQKMSFEQDKESEEQKRFLRESEQLKKHIQNLIGEEESENSIRKEYDQRYQNYKKTLKQFSFNKENMQRLLIETKMIIKDKIEENLRKQIQNLDKIQSIMRKNFDVDFKSYKERASNIKAKSIYGQKTFHSSPLSYQGDFSKKQTFGSGSLRGQLKFGQVLQQCFNLIHCHYFDFEYIGEKEKINETKNELKLLMKQRIELDEYFCLKRPLRIGGVHQQRGDLPAQMISEFEEERYLSILKLQHLAQILGERESAQQNLLKEYFSSHHTFTQLSDMPVDQINDEKNVEFLANFMVRTFQQKLSDSNSSDLIKVQLTKPNFSDPSVSYIWLNKSNSAKSHYDVFYTLRKEDEKNKVAENPLSNQQQKKVLEYKMAYCCPGKINIWVCIAFVRQLVANRGLKKQKFPMIKDKQLRHDFERLVQLMK